VNGSSKTRETLETKSAQTALDEVQQRFDRAALTLSGSIPRHVNCCDRQCANFVSLCLSEWTTG
jgi:hypothetical protein